MLQSRLVARIEDDVWPDPAADRQHERQAVAGADDRVRDAERAVEVVPATQRVRLALDAYLALSPQDEEALLVRLVVVERHGLTLREHIEIDRELVGGDRAIGAHVVGRPLEVADALHPPGVRHPAILEWRRAYRAPLPAGPRGDPVRPRGAPAADARGSDRRR